VSKDEVFAAFGDQAARARAVYDPDGHTDLDVIRGEEGADEMMHETARFTAERFADAGLPAYLYRFDYVAAAHRVGAGSFPPYNYSGLIGAVHGEEIPFVFDTVAARYGDRTTEQDQQMARMMSAYWVAFARTGIRRRTVSCSSSANTASA
jgi:para-nitrobenzyl esterase